MNSLTALPDKRIATFDSQETTHYFTGIESVLDAVRIRSADEMVEGLWQDWAPVLPRRMSSSLINQILSESPELPAEKDPSTSEFIAPEE